MRRLINKVISLRNLKSTRFNTGQQNGRPWIDRAQIAVDMLKYLKLDIKKVADIGCGDQKVRRLLEEETSKIEYYPFDLIPQSVEVRKFDLTTDEFDDEFDVVFLLGVLEYVDDVSLCLKKISQNSKALIVSHTVSDLIHRSKFDVARLGWKNHLSIQEFETYLDGAGFVPVDRRMTENRATCVWACTLK